MKRCIYLFLGSMLGSFCMLTALSEQAQNVKIGTDGVTSSALEIDKKDLDSTEILSQSMKSRYRNSKSFILFQAELSQCRIGLNDRLLLADNSVDFVTAFNGNDFSCKVLKKGGIEISPQNGQSFTLSIPPVPEPGPVPSGLFDHVKFLAYSLFENLPSEEASSDSAFREHNHRQLCSTWVGSGAQLNVNFNPFGKFSPAPNSDPRLACFSFSSLDPNSFSTFDWICTNNIIYVLVERLPGSEELFGNYAAYTYLIPVARRNSAKNPLKDVHTFQTFFDSNGTTVTWVLDGKPVFRITQIGHFLNEENAFIFCKGKPKPLRDPTRFQVANHGGVDQTVILTGVQTGIALFTLLDFFPPATKLDVTREERINSGIYEGLVRLESTLIRPATNGFYYNNPLLGGPAIFFQNSILDPLTEQFLPTIPSSFRIFGQGAKLRLYKYTLSIEERD